VPVKNSERRILEMIRAEDEKDNPPTRSIKEMDLRKIKINKAPIEQKPDHRLKNKVRNMLDVKDFSDLILTIQTFGT
jgi:hypothetical protein